ncbi:MAG: TIR domain-containing protein [SAR202 cluster bacterium]|nr:TIR domain-containing protein [SAR202 cluster bacterium]
MNPEHVEVLRLGSDAVNAWRRSHSGQRMDLSGADLPSIKLIEADLSGANLSLANLVEADLTGCLLQGADLAGTVMAGAMLAQADLFEANLVNAILSQADMGATNLSQANLLQADLSSLRCYNADFSGAALSKTDLSYATLDRCNFSRAQFKDAVLNETVFADCDLSASQGLDSVKHHGPSTLGLDTLVRSRGNIPPAFLRGAGVPEDVASYVRSLWSRPVPFDTCIISHSSRDDEFAGKLHADLQSRGVRAWKQSEVAVAGRRLGKGANRAIRIYDRLLFICSSNSLRNEQLLREMERALNKERAIGRENENLLGEGGNLAARAIIRDPQVLVLIRLDNYVFDRWQHPRKSEVTRRTICDFVGWDQSQRKYDQAFAALLNVLDTKSWPLPV